jgi:NAD(P)-dependent dehydrogenase (short-subunit alcohol dehydrogenase family)
MKRALQLRGANVYSLARSGSGEQTEVGDASDPAVLERLRQRIVNEQGRLDFLICNACPPLMPLRLEVNATGRIAEHINLAVSLMLVPLCAFLELLNSSGGCAVMISSTAVEQPVREWPHYVAAKQAVEALAQVASLQYPRVSSLIVRPQKLVTTLTNTPMGRLGGLSPVVFADRIVTRLEEPLAPGKTEILH